MSKTLFSEVTNTSGIQSIRYSNAHNDSSALVNIVAETTSLTIGDSVTVDLGYQSQHNQIFSGYVKSIRRTGVPNLYTITAYDEMIRASDYFIASKNPNNPFSRTNITAEDLVQDVLALAGLTNYGYDATSFTFGVDGAIEVNLVTAYDYCKSIADALAWHLYADNAGKVWFVERWNRIMDTDVSTKTLTDKILNYNYIRNETDLRNRVVVYGRNGITAVKKESSPYLPAGFYKSVVAGAEWIDTQSMADKAAQRNLDLLNHLTEELNITIEGNSTIQARDIIEINIPKINLSGDWYVNTVDHNFSKSGFVTSLLARK